MRAIMVGIVRVPADRPTRGPARLDTGHEIPAQCRRDPYLHAMTRPRQIVAFEPAFKPTMPALVIVEQEYSDRRTLCSKVSKA